MPHVIATDRAMFWAVGSPIVAADLRAAGWWLMDEVSEVLWLMRR